VLKLARSSADLNASESIEIQHISEAISLRVLDRAQPDR
jgi:predicted ATPase with chaperone activity